MSSRVLAICGLVIACAQLRAQESRPESRSEASIATLIHDLSVTDEPVRRRAAHALGERNEEAKPAVAALSALALETKDASTRHAAIWALARTRPEDPIAIPALVAALNDENPDVRQSASWGLVPLGAKAEAAVEALIGVLGDERVGTRINAALVLEKVGPPARDAVPALLQLLSTDDDYLFRCAADALRAIEPQSDAAIPILIRRLSDSADRIPGSAAARLAAYGPRATAALPELVALLTTGHHHHDAADAIVAIDRSGASLPLLLPLLAREDRVPALPEVLVGIGCAPAKLVPALEATLLATSHPTRAGMEAIRKADPGGAMCVPALTRLLAHPDSDARWMAATELANLGVQAAPAVPELLREIELLISELEPARTTETRSDAQDELRCWEDRRFVRLTYFLGALRAIGPGASAALPALLERSTTGSSCIRSVIVRILPDLDPSGSVAVDALIARLADSEWGVRAASVEALGRLGPRAAAAVPALAVVLKGGDHAIRQRITKALAAIGEGGPEVRALLIGQLVDPSEPFVAETADALRIIEARLPAPDVAALAHVLREHPDPAERVHAAYRLQGAGRAALPAVSALVASLKSGSPNLQRAVAAAIGGIGPGAAEVVPALLKLLEARVEAAMGEFASAPTILAEFDEAWRIAICEQLVDALGRIGPAAREALPLIRLIGPFGVLRAEDEGPWFREAIERIEPPKRTHLEIVIDPELAVAAPTDSRPAVRSNTEIEPDGAFRVVLHDDYGPHALVFGGEWFELFLRRDAGGRQLASGDLWHFTDCGPPFTSRDASETGTLTLRSGAWGTGRPIEGLVKIGGVERAFAIPDPFATK